MTVEILGGAVTTLVASILGWIIKRINDMEQRLNDHTSQEHLTREQTQEIVLDKTDYLHKSIEEVKAQLKGIQDTLTGMARWQGRQEAKGKDKNS